jgi:hypothetical protein
VGLKSGAPLVQEGADIVSETIAAVGHLDRSTLPIQGPPGTGKTYVLDFITEIMPDALAFDTPRELMHHALSRVTVDGLYAEFGVNNGGTIAYIARQKPAQTIHGFDSFEGLPEDWSGQRDGSRIFQSQGAASEGPGQCRAASGLV